MKPVSSIVSIVCLAFTLSACGSEVQCAKSDRQKIEGLSQTSPDVSPCEIEAIAGGIASGKSSDEVMSDHVDRVWAKNGVDEQVAISDEERHEILKERREELERKKQEQRDVAFVSEFHVDE